MAVLRATLLPTDAVGTIVYDFTPELGVTGDVTISGDPGFYFVVCRAVDPVTSIEEVTEHHMDCLSADDCAQQMQDFADRNHGNV